MVTGGRPINAMSPETIGLTLAEGKSVLAGMQTQLVQAQADIYIVNIGGSASIAAPIATSRTGARDD